MICTLPTRWPGYLMYSLPLVMGLFACRSPPDREDSDDSSTQVDPDTTGSPKSESDENTAESSDATTQSESDSTDETSIPVENACGDLDGASCYAIDLLFVIDDSGSMAEEQRNLANNFELLVEQLNKLTDTKGNILPVSLNIMFTNSNMGHPNCRRPKGSELSPPAMGEPVASACLDRLPDFVFAGTTPPNDQQIICTDFCNGRDFVPEGSKVLHWRKDKSNIEHDGGVFPSFAAAKQALTDSMVCLGLQGIAGCGYESPLEAMLQALNPKAEHNTGPRPFLRDGATLAIVLLGDEDDCSPLAPDGYFHWSQKPSDNQDFKYWAKDANGVAHESSAICWNGGTSCKDDDNDGVYETCKSADHGVLHPISRYTSLLNDYWGRNGLSKNVVMLGILGVPPVLEHDEKTHIPTKGGVFDLEYRKKWRQSDVPAGSNELAADLDLAFGVGKGCSNPNTGYAMPPVRTKEVCESLNFKSGDKETVRCCIESICDENYSDAIACLAGIIQSTPPIID